MGQRLVIHAMVDGKELANVYYHWSGYTFSAIQVVSNIIKLDESYAHLRPGIEAEYEEWRDYIVTLFGLSGAGYPASDKRSPMPGHPQAISRNEGFIATDEEEMLYQTGWSEGDVMMYFDTQTVDFEVIFLPDEFDFDFEDEDDHNDHNVFVIDSLESLISIPFDRFDALRAIPSDTDIIELKYGVYYGTIR